MRRLLGAARRGSPAARAPRGALRAGGALELVLPGAGGRPPAPGFVAGIHAEEYRLARKDSKAGDTVQMRRRFQRSRRSDRGEAPKNLKTQILINYTAREVRIAILEERELVELLIEREDSRHTVGDIFLGRVTAVIPGIQAAFVDIGQEKAAFLHVSDVATGAIDPELLDDEDVDKSRGRKDKESPADREPPQEGAGHPRPGAQGSDRHEGPAHLVGDLASGALRGVSCPASITSA